MASVVVVSAALKVPDGSTLLSVMVLPERGVVPALRVPERVNGVLSAGVVVEGVRVVVVGVIVATALVEADEADAFAWTFFKEPLDAIPTLGSTP